MFHLRSLSQVVGLDEGIPGLLEGGEQVKDLLESELDAGGRLGIARMVLHGCSVSRRCVIWLPGVKAPSAPGCRRREQSVPRRLLVPTVDPAGVRDSCANDPGIMVCGGHRRSLQIAL